MFGVWLVHVNASELGREMQSAAVVSTGGGTSKQHSTSTSTTTPIMDQLQSLNQLIVSKAPSSRIVLLLRDSETKFTAGFESDEEKIRAKYSKLNEITCDGAMSSRLTICALQHSHAMGERDGQDAVADLRALLLGLLLKSYQSSGLTDSGTAATDSVPVGVQSSSCNKGLTASNFLDCIRTSNETPETTRVERIDELTNAVLQQLHRYSQDFFHEDALPTRRILGDLRRIHASLKDQNSSKESLQAAREKRDSLKRHLKTSTQPSEVIQAFKTLLEDQDVGLQALSNLVRRIQQFNSENIAEDLAERERLLEKLHSVALGGTSSSSASDDTPKTTTNAVAGSGSDSELHSSEEDLRLQLKQCADKI